MRRPFSVRRKVSTEAGQLQTYTLPNGKTAVDIEMNPQYLDSSTLEFASFLAHELHEINDYQQTYPNQAIYFAGNMNGDGIPLPPGWDYSGYPTSDQTWDELGAFLFQAKLDQADGVDNAYANLPSYAGIYGYGLQASYSSINQYMETEFGFGLNTWDNSTVTLRNAYVALHG